MAAPSAAPLPQNSEALVDTKSGRVAPAWYRFFADLAAHTLPAYAVAELPANPTRGRVAFAFNGRKAAEAAGAGTGVLIYFDGSAWRRADDGTTVAA